MLTYQDALDLKEAGFSLRSCEYAHVYGDKDKETGGCAYCSQPAFIVGDEHYIIPTLEELIEACGAKKDYDYGYMFDLTIHASDDKWVACYTDENYHEITEHLNYGSSPIQAVKNLYCALHKIDNT
jgi:hypothetical protein